MKAMAYGIIAGFITIAVLHFLGWGPVESTRQHTLDVLARIWWMLVASCIASAIVFYAAYRFDKRFAERD